MSREAVDDAVSTSSGSTKTGRSAAHFGGSSELHGGNDALERLLARFNLLHVGAGTERFQAKGAEESVARAYFTSSMDRDRSRECQLRGDSIEKAHSLGERSPSYT